MLGIKEIVIRKGLLSKEPAYNLLNRINVINIKKIGVDLIMFLKVNTCFKAHSLLNATFSFRYSLL